MTAVAPRYALREEIGSGPESVVHAASDRQSGQEVALKRLQSSEPERRLRFRLAHLALARLAGPAVIAMHELATDEAGDYCVLALAEGAPLPTGPIDLEAFRQLMPALAAAIEALHRRGWVHGALSPESFRRDATGALKLLDAGRLWRLGVGEADPRDDVRGLGAIAHALLTGEPPSGTPLARPDVPAAMARAVNAALAPDPDDRPASVPALLEALGLPAEPPDYLLLGGHTVGLEGPCGEAERQLARQEAGEAGALLLTGPHGAGKSRLLSALVEGLAATPTLRLAGPGETPFGLLSAMLRASEPLLAAAGLAPTDDRWAPLRAFMPAWGAPPEPLEPRAQEGRLRLALATLLEAMAGDRGLLVAIDDWDDADEASRATIGPLARRPAAAGVRWVLTQREASAGAFETLALPPLGEAEVAALAEAALGQAPPPTLVAALGEGSAGRPGTLRALLRGARDRGQLSRRRGAWVFEPQLGEEPPPTPEALAAGALEGLSAAGWAAAKAGAVLGRRFGLDALARLSGPEAAEGLLALLSSGALAWEGPALAFAPETHQAVLAATPPEEAQPLHRRAAAITGPDLASRAASARHQLLAGDPEAPEAVLAVARALLAEGAIEAAETLARGLVPLALPEPRRHVLDRLQADLARLRGDGKQAIQRYEALLERETLPEARALDLLGLGRARLMRSEAGPAAIALEEALALSRDSALEARLLVTLGRSAYLDGASDRAVTTAEAALAAARAAEAPALVAEALGLLGLVSEGPSTTTTARDALAEALTIHRQLMSPLGLVETSLLLGDRLLRAGELRAAASAFEEAIPTALAIGAAREEVFIRLNMAQAWLELGRPADAADAAAEATALASALDYGYAAGFGWTLAAAARLALGEWGEARRALEEGLQLASRIGQRELVAATRLAQGQMLLELGELEPAGEVIRRELESRLAGGDPVALARAQGLKGRWLSLKGQLQEARELLVTARDSARDRGARLLTAQLQNALAYRALLADVPLEVLVFAQAALEIAEAIGARGVEAEAHWLLGEAARLDEEEDRARGHYEQVLRAARLARTPLWEALALLGLSRVGFGPQAAESREQAGRILKRLARLAGKERFVVWPERRLESALSEAPQGPLGGVAAMGAVIEALERAGTWPELLESLLATFLAASEAEAGALVLLEARSERAGAYVAIAREEVASAPAVVTARLDRRAIFDDDRWALPLALEGEALALLYLDGAEEARTEVVRQMAEGARVVLRQFQAREALEQRAERLAYGAAIARSAIAAPPEEIFARALTEGLALADAERAFLLRLDAEGGCEPRLGRDRQGRALSADTPFARALCREAAGARRGVTLEPSREHGTGVLTGQRSAVAVPVLDGDTVIAVLYADGEGASVPPAAAQAVWEEAAAAIAPLLAREA